MGLLAYSRRSVTARARANTLTVLAIALFVAGGSIGLAYYRSLDRMLVESAAPEDVIVLARGAPAEDDSQLDLESANKVAVLDGIKAQARELVSFVYLEAADFSRYADPAVIRGIDAASFDVHRASVVAGARPQSGSLQVLLGRRVAKRYPGLAIGSDVFLPGGASKITGIFEAGGSPYEDEVWTPRSALELHIKTTTSTSMTLVAADAAHAASLVNTINSRRDLKVQAATLAALRANNAGLRTVLEVLLVMLVLISVVATFSIAITMNAALAVRLPELATLAAIGIPKSLLARLVLVEALLLAFVGAALGLGAGELIRRQLDVMWLGETPVELVATPSAVAIGLALALFTGLLGGIIPAIRVRRLSIIDTLR